MEFLLSWIVIAILIIASVRDSHGQAQCTSGKSVTVFIGVHTNTTCHTAVKGRLEQPANNSWHLEVTFDNKQPHRNTLEFSITDLSLAPRVPPGYKLYPGMGYFRGSDGVLSWQAAKDACAREGAQLATAESQEEAAMLSREFSFDKPGTTQSVWGWYGASDVTQDRTFVTVKGVPLTETGFASFHPGRPNGGEYCVFIVKDKPLLDNYSCKNLLAYVCKVPL